MTDQEFTRTERITRHRAAIKAERDGRRTGFYEEWEWKGAAEDLLDELDAVEPTLAIYRSVVDQLRGLARDIAERLAGPDASMDRLDADTQLIGRVLGDHGLFVTKSGQVLTAVDIEVLADEAEAGYDVEELKGKPQRVRTPETFPASNRRRAKREAEGKDA